MPAYELRWPQVPGFSAPRGPNPMVQFDYGKQIGQGIIDQAPPAPLKARYVVLVPVADAARLERRRRRDRKSTRLNSSH